MLKEEEEERKGEVSPGLPALMGTGVGGWRQRAGGRTRLFSEVGGARGGMSALLLLLLEEALLSLSSSSGLESCRRCISQIKVQHSGKL